LLTALPLAGAMEESRKSKLLWKSAPHVMGRHYSIGLAAGAIVALVYWAAALIIREPERKKEQEKRRPGSRLSPWS
jgi:hypothetical protein